MLVDYDGLGSQGNTRYIHHITDYVLAGVEQKIGRQGEQLDGAGGCCSLVHSVDV